MCTSIVIAERKGSIRELWKGHDLGVFQGNFDSMVRLLAIACHVRVQGRRQLPQSGAAERPSVRGGGSGGPPPKNIWNLDGKSCTLGDSLYKIIHRNFFSQVLDVPRPRGLTFWEVFFFFLVRPWPYRPYQWRRPWGCLHYGPSASSDSGCVYFIILLPGLFGVLPAE